VELIDKSELIVLGHLELQVGVFGSDGSYMQLIAAANEFGANIRPKNHQWLTIPTKEAKGRKPRDIEGLFKPKGKRILAVTDGNGGLVPMFYLVKEVHIPERSFIRSTFEENLDAWTNWLTDEIPEIVLGDMSAHTLMERLGARIQRDVQAKIVSVQSPANAPATIARKSSSSPLEDTGHLLQSITYKVVRV